MIGGAINATATGTIKNESGALVGFYVNSTNVGTVRLYDDTAATPANAMGGVITPAVGWHPYPAKLSRGLHAVIGGTALDITFFIAR